MMVKAWNNLSLRIRLTLLFVGLLTTLLLALGSFLYIDTRGFLISSTAIRLRAQAQPGIDRMLHTASTRPLRPATTANPTPAANPTPLPGTTQTPPNIAELAAQFAQSQTSAEATGDVFDSTGKLLADGHTLPEQPLAAPPNHALVQQALSGENDISYITKVSSQDTLVVLIPLRRTGASQPIAGVLQLSARLNLADAVLGRQALLIGVGILLTLVLGTIGGLWLTTSALAPLQRMIVTCQRIAAGDLSQRVNLPLRSDEIGQLASSFDDMVARLDESFATQRQFIADASHELRTPLTALAGSLDVILMAPEGDPETARRMLSAMRRELQRLARIVNDLLTLTRLDAHQALRLQTIDLAALAREVAEQIRPVAGHRKIEVEATGDTRVQGDSDRLKQVLLNLVDNAMRFTDGETGEIAIRVAQSERTVRLTLSDNGSGIPPPAQPHLFERFYRVDRARARSSGGSGLGLAIARAIVEEHGGTIALVESAPGHGSSFIITLPWQPAPRPVETRPLEYSRVQ